MPIHSKCQYPKLKVIPAQNYKIVTSVINSVEPYNTVTESEL